jgi:NADP-dependent 3-hydroxy acid dehydrogenase YdfG
MILSNKIAIVTGASSGLGLATSKALIQKDVLVYGLARNREKLASIQRQLGEKFIPVSLDITQESVLSDWAKTTFSAAHSPSILINNAGIGSFQKVDALTSSTWLEMIDTNLNSVFYMTTVIIPFMKENSTSSHIINIGSILGSSTREEGAAYCSSKYGLSAFSEVLFKELRHYNIKVTIANPGSIETDFFKSSGIDKHSNMLQADDLANTLIHILETPDNMLINEITIRPLNPKKQ